MAAMACSFAVEGTEHASRTLWDWIAYGTRVGKGAGIGDMLNMPVEDLNAYLDALSRMVEREQSKE